MREKDLKKDSKKIQKRLTVRESEYTYRLFMEWFIVFSWFIITILSVILIKLNL